jgi:hypothetical protein
VPGRGSGASSALERGRGRNGMVHCHFPSRRTSVALMLNLQEPQALKYGQIKVTHVFYKTQLRKI